MFVTILMRSDIIWYVVAPYTSVTRTVNVEALLTVGVPDISPVDELSVRPAGSVPVAMVHVNGAVPPVAARNSEYAMVLVPSGSVVVVITGVGLTTMLKSFAAVYPEASVTWMVKPDVLVAVGVPEITPDEESMLTPGGKLPAVMAQVNGVEGEADDVAVRVVR